MPWVWWYASARWSEPALLALYGDEGRMGVSSVNAGSSGSRSPYTSSVDTWTKRRTPFARAASSSVCVPTTLVRTKGPALAMERSTWLSAAKCTTAPKRPCAKSRAMVSGSAMSPRTKR